MKKIEVLQVEDWIKNIQLNSHKISNAENTRFKYKAMYSSWWNGIVTDPDLMLLPIDDHQVHRGDAVFEAMKVINKKVYLVDAHLERLERSAQAIALKNPYTKDFIKEVIFNLLEVSSLSNAIVRLFLSRGPGSFSTNPYDTIGTQLYVVLVDLTNVTESAIELGVKAGISKISPKESWFAQIKSCNYLHNVLMKKEAIDRNLDFTLGVTEDGFVTEGSTENVIIFSKNNQLIKPHRQSILLGTTMERAFELSKSISEVKDRREENFRVQDLKEAKELMLMGTTLDVISITNFEGESVGDGLPGPISKILRELVVRDQH